TQLALLTYAATRLAAGGRLLYSTCSVLPQENDAVIERFMTGEGRSLRVVPVTRLLDAAGVRVPGLVACSHGIQLLPGGEAGTDGFYYACVEKDTAGPT